MYLFFLPTYSPHLNPIEILWRFLKYRWLQKLHYSSWSRLKKAVFAIIRLFGQEYRICFDGLVNRNKVKGSNLNQIAHKAHADGIRSIALEAHRLLQQLSQLLDKPADV
ncbi:hypothetical protein CWM47_37270 [Spirosoma pollinicola]|uniref:Tc1-like transposase DDE domain-containing protein n=1 Tax=Spirosoma pollinicola TaxID=2057025 RepID=A0A2K8ZAT2_9BACT|nr:hypothetical protein CWM47_37270 [Spirosoma pollinicola]